MPETEQNNNTDQAQKASGEGTSLVLRTLPDPILRDQCRAVEKFDKKLRRLVKEMKAVMRNNDGIGLAGPQVGFSSQFFTAEIEEEFLFLANPQLVETSQTEDELVEGCLSLPGRALRVARASEITVTGQDQKGKKKTLTLNGLWARVVLHEMDHLRGVLISDCGLPVPPAQEDNSG